MDSIKLNLDPSSPTRRLRPDLGLILAAWLLSLGIDFLLHAGILARLYLVESPFLLPPESAFARIPLGYFTFLVLTVALWWLIAPLGARGAAHGFKVGAISGAVVWGALLIGLFSISTAPADLLGAWWLGQAVELGAAGAVLGAGRVTPNRRPIYARVAFILFACLVATILLQVLGWAPAMQSRPLG